jgi:hypothetical protein
MSIDLCQVLDDRQSKSIEICPLPTPIIRHLSSSLRDAPLIPDEKIHVKQDFEDNKGPKPMSILSHLAPPLDNIVRG